MSACLRCEDRDEKRGECISPKLWLELVTNTAKPLGKLVQPSLGETIQAGFSKLTQFPKPIDDRTGKPVTQEIVGKSQGKRSSNRMGELVKDEEKRVMKDHDRRETCGSKLAQSARILSPRTS